MFLINFNQWKCACVGINNLVILLRARYKCNHNRSCFRQVFIHPSIHCFLCPIGAQPLNRARSSVSSFNFQHPFFPLSSSSSCLCFLPRLPITCTLPSTFPSAKCFRTQFLHNMWPIQIAFFLFTVLAYYAWPRTYPPRSWERNPWRQDVHRATRRRSQAIDMAWRHVDFTKTRRSQAIDMAWRHVEFTKKPT